MVKTGFTKKVDEVNKYPAVTNNETIKGIWFLFVLEKCLMTKSNIKVEINSLIQKGQPDLTFVENCMMGK